MNDEEAVKFLDDHYEKILKTRVRLNRKRGKKRP
jgi:hypothetical protein